MRLRGDDTQTSPLQTGHISISRNIFIRSHFHNQFNNTES